MEKIYMKDLKNSLGEKIEIQAFVDKVKENIKDEEVDLDD